MMRSPGAAGFVSRPALVASTRLTQAVAVSLAFAATALSLIAMLTIKLTMAMPIPA